jgi:RNA polymerase sigma-70 factor, ECF subfamily
LRGGAWGGGRRAKLVVAALGAASADRRWFVPAALCADDPHPYPSPQGGGECDRNGSAGCAFLSLGLGRTRGGAALDPDLKNDMLRALPSLRAFAISLCGRREHADDLVQETLVRAMAAIDDFERGTNMRAWLFTILRNLFHAIARRGRREVEDPDGSYVDSLGSPPEQGARLDLQDLGLALARLPPEQREAVLLVGAQGVSYEEAARITGCALGTIKSRVSRARATLAGLLSIDDVEDLGADRVTRAALR